MSPPPTAVAALIAAALGAPCVAGAQLRATVDIGGASIRYADTVRLTATTVAPSLRLDAGSVTVRASGAMSLLGAEAWSSQGAVAVSALSPPRGSARLELVADAGGSLHQDHTRTGRYLGVARLHAGSTLVGLWLGGGVGRASDGASWHPVAQGDAGIWARLERLALLGMVTPSAVGDSIRYTDLQSVARWEGSRADVLISGGFRHGDALVWESRSAWGSVSATLWVLPRVGLVADVGSYPVDLTQGFPGGRYASLALRVAPHRRAAGRELDAAPARSRPGGLPNADLDVSARSDGGRVLRVFAPRARSVEIMGDFTGWKPVSLARSAGGWEVVLSIAPGAYQMNVRLDGGPWVVPAGTMEMKDEFGSPVGLVVIR